MLEHTRQGPWLPISDPWRQVTSCLDQFITKFTQSRKDQDWVVFIDTNPALTVYTEMALAAADRLIVPCSADVYSKQALSVLFWMVYGIESPRGFLLNAVTYKEESQKHTTRTPKIQLIVNNRHTIYGTRAAKAFLGVSSEITATAYSAYQKKKECFVDLDGHICRDSEDFRIRYTCQTRDFHTTGVVAMRHGQPFYSIKGATRKPEIDSSLESIQKLVQMLP
ncbi:uncharacterized protein LOC134189195 [Corticium candelabrum]|uniref:uncharacterized protein LOC134189195 n=1 Tax=Corticium candelabrum TaxID=121492 RepID=UPI002E262A69|nr:uncharacterized protein LOC134189195 [Corticium candelabrum]